MRTRYTQVGGQIAKAKDSRLGFMPAHQFSLRISHTVFAVHVSSLCPQADASGKQLRRNHLPVLRSSRIIREGRTIRTWQRYRHCTGRGQTSCTFRFSTAVAMLKPQQPPGHRNERTVLDLPSRGREGEPISVPILCLAVSFKHSIILSTDRIP